MDISSDVFRFIVSMSAVVIAGVLVIGVYYVLGVIREVQQLVRSVRVEVESLRLRRKEIELRGRTMIKLLRLLGSLTTIALRRK